MFECNTSNQVCCSKECSRLNNLNNTRKRKRGGDTKKDIPNTQITRPCLKCGKDFSSSGNWVCTKCTVENEHICNGSEIGFWNGIYTWSIRGTKSPAI